MNLAGVPNVTPFDAPEQMLADIDARSTAALISAAADVALVIDGQGVIRDVSIGNDELVYEGSDEWVGRHWLETVTVESRPKVLAMLRDAAATRHGHTPWRQVNHPEAGSAGVPVMYSAVQFGDQGRVVAVGRDLRTVSTLQQRLVDAQQAMERDYLRLRQAEARYRLLFETVSEPVVVLDGNGFTVLEINPAATRLFGDGKGRLAGRPFSEALAPASRQAVSDLFASVRATGRGDDISVQAADGGAPLQMSATLFRQDGAPVVLVRLLASASEGAGIAVSGTADSALLRAIESVPDAFVVTDPQGRVLTANSAFADLLQLPAGERPQGQSLDRWMGRSGVDLNVLLGALRQHGVVRLFPTTLRGAYGGTTQVEISGVSVPQGDPPCLGFTIRDVGRRLAPDARSNRELPRSAGQLAELVGRVPLKDIVGETVDLIEKLCIEAALELTRDNRASAAEMLGLSRQSLYVKLRRYGLGDLGGVGSDQAAANNASSSDKAGP